MDRLIAKLEGIEASIVDARAEEAGDDRDAKLMQILAETISIRRAVVDGQVPDWLKG